MPVGRGIKGDEAWSPKLKPHQPKANCAPTFIHHALLSLCFRNLLIRDFVWSPPPSTSEQTSMNISIATVGLLSCSSWRSPEPPRGGAPPAPFTRLRVRRAVIEGRVIRVLLALVELVRCLGFSFAFHWDSRTHSCCDQVEEASGAVGLHWPGAVDKEGTCASSPLLPHTACKHASSKMGDMAKHAPLPDGPLR
jgi:hypothetical protein